MSQIVYPLLLCLFGLLLAFGVAHRRNEQIDLGAREDFEHLANRTELEIRARFDRVVRGLTGLSAYYSAQNQEVGRQQFRWWVEARHLDTEFPGVRGFGFIRRVERSDLNRFVHSAQADGAPDFAIRQLDMKHLEDLFVIQYIYPEERNKGATGLDIGSEALRRAAIQQAIHTGAATVTGAITLVQADQKTPGVLMFLPVYRRGAPIDLPAQRREALVGVVYAPIVMKEILRDMPDVQSGMLDFEIMDSPINGSGGTVMYDADDHTLGLAPDALPSQGRRYSLRMPLQLPGRSITLSMNSTTTFEATVQRREAWLILAGGSLISLLLGLMLWLQTRGRLRAEERVILKTQDLENALRDNEAILSTLNLHNIVSVADPEGNIIDLNPAFSHISGYSREELLGQNHRIVKSGAHGEAFWTDMWKTISSGLPWRGQVLNRAKDGHFYWVDTLIAPFIGADGKIARYVSIRTDITASKQAEEELRWRQTLLDKMSNSSPLAFLVVDNRTDEILYFNHRFCELWGIEHLELSMQRGELKNADIIPHCLQVLADVAAFAKSCEPLQDEDNRITLEDEIAFTDDRTVRRFTTQIRDAEDSYFGRFYIFEDVTERKRSEKALEEATRAAQAAAVSKGQFLANMSHEIRTPMNAILGLLRLMQDTELTPRQRDYASKTEGAAQSLLGLLNDILDFSKVEAGKMTLESEPFRLDRMLRNLSVVLSANVGNKPIEVLFDVDDGVPEVVRGDAMRLQQVLVNLGGNAVKFTSEGQVVLSLRKLGETPGAVQLEFAVQDTGIGIAPEQQAHIFTGFSQAEGSTTRRFGGTGLGLAISKRFVELMGGEIRIDSRVGEGSRFSFVLDMPTVAQIPHELVEPERTAAPVQRVLVVDDNPVALELMLKMIRSWGWQAEPAASGAEALQRVAMLQAQDPAAFPYSLVLMDWQMPGMDGWDSTRALRGMVPASQAQPKVIMVTGHGREMLAHRSQDEHALLDGFLVKPITASMLYDAVVEASAGHSGLRQASRQRSSARQLHGMRILVVEDNLINQQVADELLSAAGAIVSLAANGKVGVEAVAAAAPQFDVVLMDVQMPVLDGYGATRAIRQDLGLTQLPIVAMTANAMASDREACLAAGMNEHVSKPFDMTRLVTLLLRVTGFTEEPALQADTDTPAPGGNPLPEVPGLDIRGALGRMSGMQGLYLRTARDFDEILQGAIAELHEALAEPDRTVVLRRLHTLKGNAGTLGANALAHAAAQLETRFKAGLSKDEAQRALQDLEPVVQEARTLLQRALQALQGGAATPLAWPDTVRSALLGLQALLLQDDLQALQYFAEHRADLQGVPEADMDLLDAALQELDLSEALAVCERLLASAPR